MLYNIQTYTIIQYTTFPIVIKQILLLGKYRGVYFVLQSYFSPLLVPFLKCFFLGRHASPHEHLRSFLRGGGRHTGGEEGGEYTNGRVLRAYRRDRLGGKWEG